MNTPPIQRVNVAPSLPEQAAQLKATKTSFVLDRFSIGSTPPATASPFHRSLQWASFDQIPWVQQTVIAQSAPSITPTTQAPSTTEPDFVARVRDAFVLRQFQREQRTVPKKAHRGEWPSTTIIVDEWHIPENVDYEKINRQYRGDYLNGSESNLPTVTGRDAKKNTVSFRYRGEDFILQIGPPPHLGRGDKTKSTGRASVTAPQGPSVDSISKFSLLCGLVRGFVLVLA